MRDLFGAPRQCPAARLPRAVTSGLPRHHGSHNRTTAWRDDMASESVRDIRAERLMHDEACHLRSARGPIRMPLCGGSAILERTAARRRIAPQLARDGRWGAGQATSDRPHTMTLCTQERELFSLRER
jgi:hypothetical protein